MNVFIDQTKVYVKGGDGGRGCKSLYRDKYVRKGIPDGGDGGKGSDIIIRADRNLYTLLDYKYNRHFYGHHGEHGSGKHKKGKDAEDILIRVPVGTVIKDIRNGCILRDLDEDGQEIIAANGGKGGIGNRHRQEATPGEPGEEKELLFDLKLIAQAGVVGFPNVGKSTFISAISSAHPKIASYPFTTKAPVLGVVNFHDKKFVVADIPGLIEGSSEGKGLGDKFLRHIERTKIIIHIIDMAGFENRDPLKDYEVINAELKNYGNNVYKKPKIIVANKMDIEGAAANLERFKKHIKKKIYPISALKSEGLEDLIEAIAKKV
ncbi:MAG: GTPase ObgE [Candidatus Omnitrophica bacterium]|nr:GTPase ObgE [Candidatus Omnitrophota bacterium]